MHSLSTLGHFTTKFKYPRVGQLEGDQDWVFDWLVLLAPVRFVTRYHPDKDSTAQKLKKLAKMARG
jgi:hypothetical protein